MRQAEGHQITLLFLDAAADEEDEDTAEMEERWNPRFRRTTRARCPPIEPGGLAEAIALPSCSGPRSSAAGPEIIGNSGIGLPKTGSELWPEFGETGPDLCETGPRSPRSGGFR